jgi:ribosome-binding ATPase
MRAVPTRSTNVAAAYTRGHASLCPPYVSGASEAGARDGGKLRLEGKDYVVADGDVMHFRFAT